MREMEKSGFTKSTKHRGFYVSEDDQHLEETILYCATDQGHHLVIEEFGGKTNCKYNPYFVYLELSFNRLLIGACESQIEAIMMARHLHLDINSNKNYIPANADDYTFTLPNGKDIKISRFTYSKDDINTPVCKVEFNGLAVYLKGILINKLIMAMNDKSLAEKLTHWIDVKRPNDTWCEIAILDTDENFRTTEPYRFFPAGTEISFIYNWYENEFQCEVDSNLKSLAA